MIEPKDFERLERTVKTIATHRDYPGKQVQIREYLDAIEGRWREGRLSFAQWAGLVAVLLAGQPGPRTTAPA
ncbi:MAG: hypothetical protein WKF75_02140 [Singulisphaera sp.]